MKRTILFVLISLLFLVYSCNNTSEILYEPDPPDALVKVKNDINTVFSILTEELRLGAARIETNGVEEQMIRGILNEYAQKYSYIVDCAFVNPQGIMQYVEPEEYHGFEGYDISGQEQLQRLWQTKKPVMSNLIYAVEGFWAVDLEHPVIKHSNLIGSLSMLLKPDIFLTYIVEPYVSDSTFDFWIMQNDGVIVFDPDTTEIGRNLFTDELYKPFTGLIAAGRKISSRTHGYTKYGFLKTGMQDTVVKEAFWATSNIHGTEWKVVLVREEAPLK